MTRPAILKESDARRLAKVANETGASFVVKIGAVEITVIPPKPEAAQIQVDERRRPRL